MLFRRKKNDETIVKIKEDKWKKGKTKVYAQVITQSGRVFFRRAVIDGNTLLVDNKLKYVIPEDYKPLVVKRKNKTATIYVVTPNAETPVSLDENVFKPAEMSPTLFRQITDESFISSFFKAVRRGYDMFQIAFGVMLGMLIVIFAAMRGWIKL